MNEDELVRELKARLGARAAEGVRVGIGDDAAVLEPLPGPPVISVDAQVEGVHFDRRWLTFADVAHRGVSAALSDLAAMAATASAILVSWELPSTDGDAPLRALIGGLEEAADDYGVPVVGGNVSRGAALSQHTTVLGHASAPLLRSGAAAGDTIYVSGPVGAAALGLRGLMAGEEDAYAERWRRPRARLDLVSQLAIASACVDISDGLGSELAHLTGASGVGARVELARVPRVDGHAARARELGADPEDLVVAGGEDYELLFTSAEPVPRSTGEPIGVITAPGPVAILRANGRPWRGPRGFRHR